MHDVAVWAGVAGTNITIFGAAMTVTVLVLARLNKLDSRWVAVAFAVAALSAAAFVVGGIVFGY